MWNRTVPSPGSVATAVLLVGLTAIAVLVLTSSPASAQPIENATFVCTEGTLVVDPSYGEQCALDLSVFVPGAYHPGVPAFAATAYTPAIAAVAPTCEGVPTEEPPERCFVEQTTVDAQWVLDGHLHTCPVGLTGPVLGDAICYKPILPVEEIVAADFDVVVSCPDGTTVIGTFCQLPGGTIVGQKVTVSFTCPDGKSAPMEDGTCRQFSTATTRLEAAEREPVAVFYPTVTCLARNGRVDINLVTAVTAEYTLQIGNLARRTHEVKKDAWWRSPVTGRQDGPIRAQVSVFGNVVFDEVLTVDCDDAPTVSAPEVQPIVSCLNGRGFLTFQFANPTDAPRSYVMVVRGVPNRSTTAAAFGAAVRGVSGRYNQTHYWSVVADGALVDNGNVTFDCD